MLFYLDIKNLLQGCIYQRVIKYGKSYIKLIYIKFTDTEIELY